MKKVTLLLFLFFIGFGSICAAEVSSPSMQVVLFYKVSDAILQCQNAEEDIVAGQEELEKELLKHYSNRFIVQKIERLPFDKLFTPSDLADKLSFGQTPLIVKIELKGQGQSSTLYQNAFGATKVGVSPTINVQLIEGVGDIANNAFYPYDYGVQSYGAGTFAVGRSVFAAQTDPRKNTKNAVRAVFRDACKFNKDINKFADPKAYESEYNRYIGDFKKMYAEKEKKQEDFDIKLKNFLAWCNEKEERKAYCANINAMMAFGTDYVSRYIDELIKVGIYKPNE